MALRLSDALRAARATSVVTFAGSGALLHIYSGTQPTDADTAAAGTLLAVLTFGATLGTVSSEGVLTAGAITQDSAADATGTAGWFRILKSDGTTRVLDGTVTVAGGGGDLQLTGTAAIAAGQPVQVSSFVLTEQGAT